MTHRQTAAALWAMAVTLAAGLLLHGPVLQPESYHRFADARDWGVLPHAQNVLSNAVFLIAGILGLREVLRAAQPCAPEWRLVFAGSILVWAGSSWYHLAPSDDRLVWDRLAIAVTFAAYFMALLRERLLPSVQRWLIVPVTLFAVGAVLYWYGQGDLRLWILVQLVPMLATAILLLAMPRTGSGNGWLWSALMCYTVAKAAEFSDQWLFAASGQLLSGHVAKHLLAGAGMLCLWAMLRARSRLRVPS